MAKNSTNDVTERTKINQTGVWCAFDEIVSINELKENPLNPNTHPYEQIKLLSDVIKKTGWRAPITVSTRSGLIVKGHGRLQAAKLAGFSHVPVEYQNFQSEDEERAALLADNKIAELSEVDSKLLAQMFNELDFNEFGELTGYSDDDYRELMCIIDEHEEIADLDTMVNIPSEDETFTQSGDIWILGRHRLVCGDSKDNETYKLLMQSDLADMVVTDPPYNVDYKGGAGLKIENDNMNDGDFYYFLVDCFEAMSKFLKQGGSVYCWHSDSERISFQKALKNANILIKQNLIWVKNSFIIGRQDYQWKHESCLYGWKEGAAHYFTERRNLSTVTEEKEINIETLTESELKEFVRRMIQCLDTTILRFNKPQRSELHPTMKPVDLFIKQIENSSRPGQIILDPFGGSGTTIIASEKLGRMARVIELSPQYCDAIVKRYITVFGGVSTKCIRGHNEITSPLNAIS